MKNYFKMLKFLRGHQGRFGIAIVFIILSSLFEGVQLSFILPVIDRIFTNKPIVIPNKVPLFLTHIVNKLNSTDVHTLFWMVPAGFMVLFCVKQVVLFWSDYFMNDIAQAVMRDVRCRLLNVYKHCLWIILVASVSASWSHGLPMMSVLLKTRFLMPLQTCLNSRF